MIFSSRINGQKCILCHFEWNVLRFLRYLHTFSIGPYIGPSAMDILIIDDDADDTTLFCEALREILPSANCVILHDCLAVRQHVEKLPQLQMVFIDRFMHPVDGLECLKCLKLIISPTVKLIIYSGSVDEHEMPNGFQTSGVDDILPKGSTYQVLKENLKHLLVGKYNLGT